MANITYTSPRDIKSVAVIGAGSVGASWAALFLARGLNVIIQDPARDSEVRIRAFIQRAWPSLHALGIAQTDSAPFGQLRFALSATAAASLGDVIQENVSENPNIKAAVLAEVDAAASASKIILSSTGGIPPSTLQESLTHPERLVVVHPFNPSHLMPLVEVVAGTQTAPQVVEWAVEFCRYLGKEPIVLNREATGHMTNRLQFALVREAVHCLIEGIASAKDIEAAVRYGLGPRWTLMGSLLTMHLAGGGGGMAGILEHAGKAMEQWWTPRGPLTLTAEVKAKLIIAADELAKGRSVDEWVHWRDEHLVKVLEVQRLSGGTCPRTPPPE